MKMLRRTLMAGIALCAAAVASVAAAAEERPLRVDILAFAQPPVTGAAYWQDLRTLPPCHAVALRDGTGAQAAFDGDRGCVRTPGFDAAFGGFSGTGNSQFTAHAGKLKASGQSVLLNRGWRQASANLSPVLVRGGRNANGRQELEGTVAVGGTDRMPEVTLELTLTRMDGEKPQYVTLRDTRRLKPGETNYFDHPLFGVILSVGPADAAP